IDYPRGLILVQGKGSKERKVAPGWMVMEAIRGLGISKGPVWRNTGGHLRDRDRVLTSRGAKNNLYRIGQRAGVKHCHPHRFRVTFANQFLEQVLMGHANISETAHYAGFQAASRALQVQSDMKLAAAVAADAGYHNSDAPVLDPRADIVQDF